jgi:hypothetical protein
MKSKSQSGGSCSLVGAGLRKPTALRAAVGTRRIAGGFPQRLDIAFCQSPDQVF